MIPGRVPKTDPGTDRPDALLHRTAVKHGAKHLIQKHFMFYIFSHSYCCSSYSIVLFPIMLSGK